MVKELKRRDEKAVDEPVRETRPIEGVHAATLTNITSERLLEIIERLREQELYYASYEEFIKSGSNGGVHVSTDEKTGVCSIHVKADSPQEAMDKLGEYGFISPEEATLYKSRYDELAARGIDVNNIQGGDLKVLRDPELFEEFAKMALEAQERGVPLTSHGLDEVRESMKQRQVAAEMNVDEMQKDGGFVAGPDIQVGGSTNDPLERERDVENKIDDKQLLINLNDTRIQSGLDPVDLDTLEPEDNVPDVRVDFKGMEL